MLTPKPHRYHDCNDSRIPKEDFNCFTCELRADPNSTLLTPEFMESVLLRWGELALFRYVLVSICVWNAALSHSPIDEHSRR